MDFRVKKKLILVFLNSYYITEHNTYFSRHKSGVIFALKKGLEQKHKPKFLF